ncbi:uncharacterized protein M421DRAFT_147 [Didymella exigua CBS 183.55]|uniref:Uncharacterized protein n=1 Tax=Didymella exigua CBS 183.55 TaxID=1150837 RepID=A0A6A5S3P7_9PLEO|nr:uncharacterized protein M421DRAFT_147 [Didymella exigua CBS 183.55]KAF1933968.1 hypothetical protein M421DRAFT_147 [Didymella exigua CBS 183.55]
MTASQSLVPYSAPTSIMLSSRPSASSLIPAGFFTRQTGTAIATELLYRILFDIVQRFMATFQRLAAKGMDQCSSWLERKMQERRYRQANSEDRRLEIVHEASKLAARQGFITRPMTGADTNGGGPPPPRWVRDVLDGIEEGRMEEKDFWIHTHTG